MGTELTVTTCREGDPLGEAALAFYALLGFVPGEEVTAFGYPCQKLILTIPDGTSARKKQMENIDMLIGQLTAKAD